MILPPSARRYLVGGAVRDRLLGIPVQDRDFVVVGAAADDMAAFGFTAVGRDFPVFLHPRTHEEHALARTERKTAPGYRGFVIHAAPDVTLEQDLARRDLTINAMAQADDGVIVDPFGGRADLQARLLRHVSPAFAEDPVRILRLARFAARFTDFSVAPETARLMQEMVARGEVDALVPERVWQELSRGLMEARPARMITVLRECGCLARLMPALADLWNDAQDGGVGIRVLAQLDRAAHAGASLPVRTAVLLQTVATPVVGEARDDQRPGVVVQAGCSDTTAIAAICQRLKIPLDCRDLAIAAGREQAMLCTTPTDATLALALLERCDAFRKPERFDALLESVGYLGNGCDAVLEAALRHWGHARDAASAVDAGAIAHQVRQTWPQEPMRINQAVRQARIAAIAAV